MSVRSEKRQRKYNYKSVVCLSLSLSLYIYIYTHTYIFDSRKLEEVMAEDEEPRREKTFARAVTRATLLRELPISSEK